MISDTSFMYIICMLCMIKIYQTRHPDINANSYFIFGMLAFVIILGLAGIMFDGLLFSIFFTIIHLTMSFWLSAHIYYMSAWKLGRYILMIQILINMFYNYQIII